MEKKVAEAEIGQTQLEEGEIIDNVMKDALERIESQWGAAGGPIQEGLKLLRQSASSAADPMQQSTSSAAYPMRQSTSSAAYPMRQSTSSAADRMQQSTSSAADQKRQSTGSAADRMRQSTSSAADPMQHPCSTRDLRVEVENAAKEGGEGGGGGGGLGSWANEEPHDPEMFFKIYDAFHMRLSRVEKYLNMGATEAYLGEGHADRCMKPHVSKDAMLDGIVEAIRTFGSDYGVGKPLIKKHLTTRFGIDLTSQYYAKKLNNIIKYGIGKNMFVFDRHDQLFKLK